MKVTLTRPVGIKGASHVCIRGTIIQAKEIASAKALGWGHVWSVRNEDSGDVAE